MEKEIFRKWLGRSGAPIDRSIDVWDRQGRERFLIACAGRTRFSCSTLSILLMTRPLRRQLHHKHRGRILQSIFSLLSYSVACLRRKRSVGWERQAMSTKDRSRYINSFASCRFVFSWTEPNFQSAKNRSWLPLRGSCTRIYT